MTKGFLLCCVVLGVALCGFSATHYVDINSINPVAPYSTWETAATNIQDAIDVAVRYDIVLVSDGLYAPGSLRINDEIVLSSASIPTMMDRPTGKEFITGMSPLDSHSLFATTNVVASTNGNSFIVEWEAKTDRQYSIWWTSSLTNSFQLLAEGIGYPVNRYADTVYSVTTAGFYRIKVELNN